MTSKENATHRPESQLRSQMGALCWSGTRRRGEGGAASNVVWNQGDCMGFQTQPREGTAPRSHPRGQKGEGGRFSGILHPNVSRCLTVSTP